MRSKIVAAAAAVTGVAAIGLYAARPTLESDHQDTLQLLSRPGADITDMYVFPAQTPEDVVFALDVHPLIPRGMGSSTSFDPDVLYQIKIDTVGDYREHTVLQFKASGTGADQRITLYGPGPTVASTNDTLLERRTGSTRFGLAATLPDGIDFFAGPRKDPFFFDLTQFFKIQPDRSAAYQKAGDVPARSATCFRTPGVDYLADFNVLSLIVEMPRALLQNDTNNGRINVWSTASISNPTTPGRWQQIERWGRPAVKEALEPFVKHAISNRVEPWNDPTLEGAIYQTMTTDAGRSPAVADALVRVLVPDEMQVNLAASGHATYLGVETKGLSGLPTGVNRIVPDAGLKGLKGSLRNGARQFGGRDPDSPVIDLSLGAIYGSTIPKIGLAPDDHAETTCLTSDGTKPSYDTIDGFPYLHRPI